MGKSSKYPSYSSGSIYINGQNKATTSKNGNNIYTNYNMSEDERRAYEYAQKSFADSLSKVNVFDEDTKKNLQSQLEAYTLNGQKIINNIYEPMLDDLKTDVASRFGNFDNSVFMDNLNSIEENRAESINNLAQDVMAKRDELISNELAQRYTYLGFLQDIQNQMNSNILNYIGASQQNSAAGNSYNAQAYAANQSRSSTFGNYANLASGALSMMGPYGMAASAALQIAKQYI
ncbi:unknown [Fusobacterium sp. CAG:439]|nr:unknown [Fusobacterium sp. CAG:439]HIT92230.1 hypothetical protein [Candidatus Stercorousia faecigallinarum]